MSIKEKLESLGRNSIQLKIARKETYKLGEMCIRDRYLRKENAMKKRTVKDFIALYAPEDERCV